MNDLATEEDVRGFLRLCLDPSYGPKRAPLQLTRIMPEQLRNRVEAYAPHLAELREATELIEEQGRQAREKYADGLAAFIHGGNTNPLTGED